MTSPLANDLLVEPQLVFETAALVPGRTGPLSKRIPAGPDKRSNRTDSGSRRIRTFEITCVGDPRHLVARIEHDGLRDKSYQNWAFRHFPSLKLLPRRR